MCHPKPFVSVGTRDFDRMSVQIDNLQLLCGRFNSLKGDRPMEYLRARLGVMGTR